MTTNRTELVFILDRSGSMKGLESDTIGGFNAMLEKQQAVPGECRITTVLFDNAYELLHDRIDIKAVAPITEYDYFVRGSTALFDAVGQTILKIGNALKNTAEEYRADKVLFVITTDGEENASREFSDDKVKQMIEHQKEKYSWEFIFLGANIDAVKAASRIGIGRNRAQSFHSDKKGTALNYEVVAQAATSFRKSARCESLSDDWSMGIQEDFEKRDKNDKKS
ncbi:MAG: VWA domain-containing protein [Proteobacteria bacterium]|nr:VWA domain-containing protein [Pseudomonadota bacterium]